MLIVCDDMYHLLSFPSSPPLPPRLFSFDNGRGHVISNGSFSKILAPGLRLGWVEASPAILDRFESSGLRWSGGSPNHFMSNVILSSLETGAINGHIERIRAVYESRCNALCERLDMKLPQGCTFQKPEGGFFIWIHVPFRTGITSETVLQHLLKKNPIPGVPLEKVSFAHGDLFSSDHSHANWIRLAFSMYDEKQLIEGCDRLCRVLNHCMNA
jgi:DNA-binding transcriptional MocR family regulator